MAEKSINIASWPCLSNGLHYNWLVDYAAFSAFGTFELSAEEWEKRDLIVNFKGNSELTTEIDHQQAVDKAIDLVSSFLKAVFSGKEGAKNSHSTLSQLTLVCLPASTRKHTERRFRKFSEQVCAATGMQNAYNAFSFTTTKDEDGDEVDTLHIDETFFQGKQVILFDDIIASGGSIVRFAEKLEKSGAKVIVALALGKKIPDGYDNNE